MKKYSAACIVLILMCLISNARAADYDISIAFQDKKSPAGIIQCSQKEEFCFYDLNDIRVEIKLGAEKAYFQFQKNNEYLAVTTLGQMILDIELDNKNIEEHISLYKPNPLAEEDTVGELRRNLVSRVSKKKVADIRILIEQSER